MGYRVNVRILTNYKGMEIIGNNKELYNVISFTKKIGRFYYIALNGIKENECEKLNEIYDIYKQKDITFRELEIGEDMADIQERHYISIKDINKTIPDIYIKREFDDNEMEKELNKIYEKNLERA